MLINRKKKLMYIIFLMSGIGVALGLLLFALRQNISLYYTPTQIEKIQVNSNQLLRLGGFVVKNSVQHTPDSLQVKFALTDHQKTIWVKYNGILPSLFRVNQGIVAQGHLAINGIFYADQVLAKHDATYKPPELTNHVA